MTKRILALTLCIVMICSTLFGCAKKDPNDLGAYITMYLTDEIYDFDPASAYYNSDAINVLSLMYETLFTLNENGKVKKSLVEDYEIVEKPESNEYYIEFTLKEAYWSVKDQLTAEHVVFAWKRLVDFRNDYDAASLLFDIKNARAIKEGDIPVDDLGVEAVEDLVVKVSFDAPIDYDQFLLNLTSVATAPLLERYVSSNEDWAKKGSTIATSGPFKLGKINYAETGEEVEDDNSFNKNGSIVSGKFPVKKISYFYLERNSYYFRDTKRDAIDKSVKPYRLLVDCSKSAEDLLTDFKDGKLFYIGDIPMSLRTGDNAEYIKKHAEVTDALSTFVVQFNQNALIADGKTGSYLFADPAVREALSLAIDRDAIANAVVFAKAADAYVANGIFEKGLSGQFRTSKQAAALLSTSADVAAAQAKLTEAGITPSDYTFTVKVNANDDVHVTMVDMIVASWAALGFNVTTEKVYTIENNDYFDQTDSVPPDVCDDLFVEAYQRGKFEAIALDVTAFTADAYSMLSNYAYAFSGGTFSDPENDVYEYDTHITGYDSVAYNTMMEAIYYIPYFASLDTLESDYLLSHLDTKPYVDSAQSALRKLSTATAAAKNLLASAKATLNPTDAEAVVSDAAITQTVASIVAQLNALELAGKQADKNIIAAQVAEDLTVAAQEAALAISAAVPSALNTANGVSAKVQAYTDADAALKKLVKDPESTQAQIDAATAAKDAALAAALAEANATITAAEAVLAKAEAAVAAMTAAKDAASAKTLKELIQEIYTANGITPSTKESTWKEQKSTLLHKAEELLMEDLPVIPVVYNQNAILVHDDLSKVQATYYTPAYFRKTKLKNYKDYTFFNEENQKQESIFKSFPEIFWDKAGT